jgi:hypothetical protein
MYTAATLLLNICGNSDSHKQTLGRLGCLVGDQHSASSSSRPDSLSLAVLGYPLLCVHVDSFSNVSKNLNLVPVRRAVVVVNFLK